MRINSFAWVILFLAMCSGTLYSVNNFFPEVYEKAVNLSGDLGENVKIDSVFMDSGTVKIYLTASDLWLKKLTGYRLDKMSSMLIQLTVGQKIDFEGLEIYVYEKQTGIYKPIPYFLPKLPKVPKKHWEAERGAGRVISATFPADYNGPGTGFLSGKSVFVSSGHGWYFKNGSWHTQRTNTHGIVEDFLGAEAVNYFLIPYLRNAGATVFPMREIDMNREMVVVDNGDLASDPDNGIYEESGGWQDSSAKGFSTGEAPYVNGENPFEAGGNRIIKSESGAYARWTPNIPKRAIYNVYVSYSAFSARATDAHYEVYHAGGKTDVYLNQKAHGATWVNIGAYPFYKGSDKDKGSVLLIGESADSEAWFSADAVRFGGGMGEIERDSSLSTRPRWEEGSRYFAQYSGAPTSVYDVGGDDHDDDIYRGKYAKWQNETGEDSIYVSWHSNAANSEAHGTITFMYSDHAYDGSDDFKGVAGGDKLASFIQNEVVDSIRAGWDASWYSYGVKSAWFAEVAPKHNDEMPSSLVELGFHDNEQECLTMQDPKFRNLAARAVYQAITKYFADKDGKTPVFIPEHPSAVRARVKGEGSVEVLWQAPPVDKLLHGDIPDGYTVQKSEDGFAFDDGVDAGDLLSYEFTELDSGRPYYFRVVAYNSAGKSFPSSIVAAFASMESGQMLIVDGFERLDRHSLIPENLSQFGLGTLMRMVLERQNSFSYVVKHANSLEELGYSFDSASKKSLNSIPLEGYDMILWFSGEQSTVDSTFTLEEQNIIKAYMDEGGAMFVSGSEIGWDLDSEGDANDKDFYNSYLKAKFVDDDAGTYGVRGVGAAFESLELEFDNGTRIYNVEYPDILEPADTTAAVFLTYDNTGSSAAGIISTDGRKVATLGFPFETITDEDRRRELLKGVLQMFEIEPRPETPDGEPDDDSETDSSDGGDDSDHPADSDDDAVLETEEDYFSVDRDDIEEIDSDSPSKDGTKTENENILKGVRLSGGGCSLIAIFNP